MEKVQLTEVKHELLEEVPSLISKPDMLGYLLYLENEKRRTNADGIESSKK